MLIAIIIEAARRGGVDRGLEEFGSDPTLTLAALGLIGVSLAWIFVAPAIYRNLTRAAERKDMKVGKVQPPKDIWKAPPEERQSM